MIEAGKLTNRFNNEIAPVLPSYYIRFTRCSKMLIGRKLTELQRLPFAWLPQGRFNLYDMRSAKIGADVIPGSEVCILSLLS